MPEKSEVITITVEEYRSLQRQSALLDVLMAGQAYSVSAELVQAVKKVFREEWE